MMTEDYDRDRQLCFEDGSIHVLHALDHISVIFFLYMQSAMEILLGTDIVLDIFYQQGFLDVI